MQTTQRDTFGGISAILLGLSYILIGIAVMLNPVLRASSTDAALRTLVDVPIWTQIETFLFGIGSLAGIAVVQVLSRRIEQLSPDLVRWASTLGLLSFALLAIKDFRSFVMVSEVQRIYSQTDPVVQKTFAELLTPITDLDPLGFTYVGVGIWLTTINLLALRSNAWPRHLAYLGTLGGVVYSAIMLGRLTGLVPLFLATVMIGSVLGPVWYILMGLHLLRSAQRVPAQSAILREA